MSPSVASALEIDVALQPKQDDLYELIEKSKHTIFGTGGRRGGGKSGGLRRIFFLRRLKYPNTDGILLRRTRQELIDNHLTPMFREWPFVRDWWVAQDKTLVFPNGSRLLFRYAEHEKHVDKLFGVEYADVGPEEAGLFAQRELEKMKGSNRWPGSSPIKPIMVMSFMPGGRSHAYLKRIFIDKLYEGEENPDDHCFVETWGWDNVEHVRKMLVERGCTERDFYSWPEAERKKWFLASEYGRKLSSITDTALRAAWLDGSWNVFEGIVFPELKDTLHNLDNWTGELTLKGKKLYGAIDWADTGATGAEQCALDDDENFFFFDEYGDKNRTVTEHCESIIPMFNEIGHVEYILMDLPTTNINQEDLFSIQNAFRLAGLYTTQAYRANIKIGLDRLKDLLKVDPNHVHPFTGEIGAPHLYISRRKCPKLWKQMSELQREIDTETGKVKYIGDDDNLDPARYIAMSRPKAPDKKAKVDPNLLNAQRYTSVDAKAQRTLSKFDKTFGKDPNGNEWFPQ